MCSRCTLDEFTYIFAQDNFITTEAQKACKNDGGVLAQKLDRKIYIELNKCCSDEHRYRIGFVGDDKSIMQIRSFAGSMRTNVEDQSPCNQAYPL